MPKKPFKLPVMLSPEEVMLLSRIGRRPEASGDSDTPMRLDCAYRRPRT